MKRQSPTCPNCSRPMGIARTLPDKIGAPEVNVYECKRCKISYTTEDHFAIAGAGVR